MPPNVLKDFNEIIVELAETSTGRKETDRKVFQLSRRAGFISQLSLVKWGDVGREGVYIIWFKKQGCKLGN